MIKDDLSNYFLDEMSFDQESIEDLKDVDKKIFQFHKQIE